MKSTVSTISSKGQITIPAEGRVELQPVRYTLEDFIGSIPSVPNESLDLEREIEVATEKHAIRRARRMQIR